MNSALDNQTYHRHLKRLLGDMSIEALHWILETSQILHFETGQHVFRQGETDCTLYIVMSGRLRTICQTEDSSSILGDISAGEPVGELALFTKEPRTASVIALRKSTVLQLKESDYMTIVKRFPNLGQRLTQFVIDRLQRNASHQKSKAKPKNIAIISLQPQYDIGAWTDDIQQQFLHLGTSFRVYDQFSQQNAQNGNIFEEMEQEEGLNFLVCSDEEPTWAHQCISYCDLVVLLTPFEASRDIYEIERTLQLYEEHVLHKAIYLLLLHPENAALPSGTAQWLEGRQIDLHIHVRKNNHFDSRRFCRIVAHQAVGLVLGGGGTKGYAHVGAAKAMMEAGIEFDFIGGTSAGGLYGLGMACCDFDMTKIEKLCEEAKNRNLTSGDFNIPFLSLLSGKKVRAYFKHMFDETHIEDFWVNSFCVATNYSTATAVVHERGLARKRVESSIAIPGVFPPTIIDGNIYVDGGVMDNLPIETMLQKPVQHVIAISLTSQNTYLVRNEHVPTAWQMMWDKIWKRKRYRLPSMASILINSLTLNSRQKQDATKAYAAIYLELDLRKHGILEWQYWRELIDKGYEQCQEHLQKMEPKDRFW